MQRKAEYAMGFVRSQQGVRINLHHSHFPNYTAIRKKVEARDIEQYQASGLQEERPRTSKRVCGLRVCL